MKKWVNFDKIIANRDFVMLDTDSVQGFVYTDDLWDIIEQYDLDKLELTYFESERYIINKAIKKIYYPDGKVETETIFANNSPALEVDNIDPLNTFGRILVNNKLMEKANNEYNN